MHGGAGQGLLQAFGLGEAFEDFTWPRCAFGRLLLASAWACVGRRDASVCRRCSCRRAGCRRIDVEWTDGPGGSATMKRGRGVAHTGDAEPAPLQDAPSLALRVASPDPVLDAEGEGVLSTRRPRGRRRRSCGPSTPIPSAVGKNVAGGWSRELRLGHPAGHRLVHRLRLLVGSQNSTSSPLRVPVFWVLRTRRLPPPFSSGWTTIQPRSA